MNFWLYTWRIEVSETDELKFLNWHGSEMDAFLAIYSRSFMKKAGFHQVIIRPFIGVVFFRKGCACVGIKQIFLPQRLRWDKNSTETEITRNFKHLRFSNRIMGKLLEFLEISVSVEFLLHPTPAPVFYFMFVKLTHFTVILKRAKRKYCSTMNYTCAKTILI